MTQKDQLLISFVLAAAPLSMPAFAQTETKSDQSDQSDKKDPGAANKPSSFYIAISGGVNLQQDHNLAGIQAPAAGVPGMAGAPATINVNYSTGAVARTAIGYRWKKGFIKWLKPRTEIEVSTSRAAVSSGSFNAGNQVFSGRIKTTTIKIGFSSDIRWSDTQTVVPFFSSGYGIAILDPKIEYFPITATPEAPAFRVSGKQTRFARHNGIGLSYTGIKGVDIYTEGRYSQISGANFDRRFIANNGFSASVRDKTNAFEISVGTRLRF